MDKILIRGARTHNLKNIDLELPRNQLIVITGLSGSGKSSLAFDTIFAEGQRRYMESLSTYARQFLALLEKPDVDVIEGLSPTIAIQQKSSNHNPRSTVGTITEIHDYLRLLFARIGMPHCPRHGGALDAQTISQMVDFILDFPEGTRLMLTAPLVRARKGEHLKLMQDLRQQGFVRVIIDGDICELERLPMINRKLNHDIAVVVDRFVVRENSGERLAQSLQLALQLSGGSANLLDFDSCQLMRTFSSKYACPECGYVIKELEPRMFSFNNPHGACQNCDGLGAKVFIDPQLVVRDGQLSIAAGAIRGWDQRTPYFYPQMQALAKHYDFKLDVPFNDLPQAIKEVIFYGSRGEKINFIGRGNKSRHASYEGVINTMNRRYLESDNDTVRAEIARYLNNQICPDCNGARLNETARGVLIENYNLTQLSQLSLLELQQWFARLALRGSRATIAAKILREIERRLAFLINVGLQYLTLSRSAETLSGGEAQRIRLAAQIGAGLVGVLYVLDEPSIGLHQRDNQKLLDALHRLRDLGNTVLVVEHDEDAIRSADYIVDIGPAAGSAGGEIVACGNLQKILTVENSLTARYLCGKEKIAIPKSRRRVNEDDFLELKNARGNNLQGVDLRLPLGLITCVTGVSGSGKSTLVNETLYKAVAAHFGAKEQAAPYDEIRGLQKLRKVINVTQSPIGRTPRSNPATYCAIFTAIRELFAQTAMARARGYKMGRFSFNVGDGRCQICQGEGYVKIEMHFLADVFVACDACAGKRYNRETLEITYKDKNIDEVLAMTVAEALQFFAAIPTLKRRLQTLIDVGLGYIKLGQSALTLSGGEAQRIKLAKELSKSSNSGAQTLYILDEPTTGLHFHDVKQLIKVLLRLRDNGNTIVVIEHNLDVIKSTDWIVDLGPEGGAAGGNIVVCGTPEEVAASNCGHTGEFLARQLANS